ncbi:MAG: presenilin family intramembrane aspartyl protease [Patescibacteria group bacterium]
MSKGKLLINELFFYLIAQVFGLLSAWKILQLPAIQEQISKQKISWFDLIFSVLIGTAIILLTLKFLKHKMPYKIFFGFLFFLGIFYTLNIWLTSIPSLILTVILFWSHQRWPKIITHNLIITLTIIWAAISLGLVISPWQIIIILLILSLYDLIAVWKTKHMIKMFKGLAERGVIFALIIPAKIKNLFQSIPEIKPGSEFLFLGTGDLALPMIFVISAFRSSCDSWSNSCKFAILPPILIILGTLLGIVFINLVMMGKERKPLPALPPLAIGAILGFLISGLF